MPNPINLKPLKTITKTTIKMPPKKGRKGGYLIFFVIKLEIEWVMVEKKLATNTYYLLGSLLTI